MRSVLLLGIAVTIAAMMMGCYFSEFAQDADLEENIDEVRTGCEIDADSLIEAYKQYEANKYHYDGSTPTPGPVNDGELATSILLERVWELGCETGRRDVVGSQAATLMGLQDRLDLLADILADLQVTPTFTPTPDD